MKKVICVLTVVFMLFAFPSCDSSPDASNDFINSLQAKAEQTTVNANESLDDTVYVTPSGERYHKKSCGHIKKSKTVTAVPLSEAIEEGYTACKSCYK